ncbi:hypothetical protein A4X13_0g9019 [Tilletia indica]|uniref:Uncharacterized protein n=1 Tax=Tilletia indica TaxID=43049 RepID=A0A8T8SBT5_9BASI|nr:hypothetical protein A4X13_0g9019 [Tilletia indica]
MNTQQRNRYYEGLRHQVWEATDEWLDVDFPNWTPRRWREYMQRVREDEADRIASIPAPGPREEPHVPEDVRMAALRMSVYYLTGCFRNASTYQPRPKVVPISDDYRFQLDQWDQKLADYIKAQQRESVRAPLKPLDSPEPSPRKRAPRLRLPDIPKRQVEVATAAPELEVVAAEPEDAVVLGPSDMEDLPGLEWDDEMQAEFDALSDATTSEEEDEEAVGQERNRKNKTRQKNKKRRAAGKGKPRSVRLWQLLKVTKKLSKSGRQKHNRKVRAALQEHENIRQQILGMGEGKEELADLTSYLSDAIVHGVEDFKRVADDLKALMEQRRAMEQREAM